MYFKISSTMEKDMMENVTEARFKYPNLYTPEVVISGLTEVSIPLITMEEPDSISLAIWGMLPSDYQGEWELFQNLTNTLNIHTGTLDTGLWFTEALAQGRCLVPVTGFFTSMLRNGEVYPYFISAKKDALLYLAGMYTVLEDGFMTCTLLTGPLDEFTGTFQNLVNFMPIPLSSPNKETWLSKDTSIASAKRMLETPQVLELTARPIAKELFNQDISYDSLLMPFEYPQR